MQLDKIKNDMADWIVIMAKNEGSKDYARERLKELAKDPIFDGIIELVKQKMEQK
jgi:hypothetical protein